MTRTKLAYAFLAVLGTAPVAAHAADQAAPPPPAHSDEGHMERRANHIEGHIAFLKAELAITPAQEAAWGKVADAMRDDVKDYEAKATSMPQTAQTAVTILSQRADFAELRAKGETRFLTVFKPLYDSLSSEQKQTADELFASHDSE